jgi:hypothetical protein
VLKPKSPGAIVTVFAELLSMTGSEKMASLKLSFVRKFRTRRQMTGGGRRRPVGVGGDLDAHEIITVAEHHPIDADRVEPVEGAACTHGAHPEVSNSVSPGARDAYRGPEPSEPHRFAHC